MKAELISVGTEILLGNILNTNSRFLSIKLAELGIDVYFHTTVGDNPYRLKEAFEIGYNRSNLIILTGGLGPTEDDLTKEIICEILGKKLILEENILIKINSYFRNCNKGMPSNNKKQALIPEDSIILPNDVGTAPGVLIEVNDKIIVLLPGPPKELELMFTKYVYPILRKKSGFIIKSRVLKTIGIGESLLETYIEDIIKKQSNPTVATYAKEGQVEIRVTVKASEEEKANQLLNNTISEIDKRIKSYIYSYDNETLEEVVFKLLDSRNMTIAFSESCTGGLISSRFTQIPGVSRVFDRGIVSYSNESKIEELGVSNDTLLKHGAVSSETAIEMARGLREKSGVDIALSVTGIAGPTGGTLEKPVGLVYMGIATKDKCYALKFNFNGDRKSIQKRTADYAFNEIRKYLLNIK